MAKKSKILLSIGVATLLYSSGFSQEITLNNPKDFSKYFTIDNNNVYLKDSYKKQDLTFKFNNDLGLPDDWSGQDETPNLNIDLGEHTLSFTQSDSNKPTYVTNFNLSAKDIKTQNIILQAFKPSTINGNLEMKGEGEVTGEEGGSMVLLFNDDNTAFKGGLNINGNLTADSTVFATYGNFIKVNGNANISNSDFKLVKRSYTDLEAHDAIVIQAKNFNKDILEKKNFASAWLLKFINDYVPNANFITKDALESGYVIDVSDSKDFDPLVDYKLSIKDCDGNQCLVINGGVTDAAKDKLTQLKVDVAMIDTLLKETLEGDETQKEEWEKAKAELNKQKQEIEKLINEAKSNGGKIDDSKYLDLVAPNLNSNDKASILALRSITDQLGSIGADLASREGVKLALNIKKDTDNTGKSISNLNSSSSSVNTTMNVANDVSIGQRVAILNNPFGNYASKMSGLKFAALESDMRPSYVNDYTQSVWANAFGGANIIDGDSGAMYGATIGLDKQANDQVLLGMYFTYTNAKIKDNTLEQKSDNFQLGLYSNINIAPQWEIGLKAYAQISPTDQDHMQVDGAYNSSYMSKFLGLSANAGRVFDFSNNTFFVKPFAGVNYYLSYTPSHTENGTIAKDIDSMGNNSASLEIGAEFRKYIDEKSYIFATPKIEQFIINSGDDYIANLSINNAFFTSVEANNKKKTYGQIIVGGNIDFTEQLSMNVGLGAKQILAGKVDNKNETYLSGQIGLKYKF
ncbi:autotransporter outer membrane beta-barrel domain-containing protein [Campylobacter estrildidarum]|uniref:Autotransporter outer membrane beta-barrel domain-containing protein n=1 Tax=Campylobacter estrildidarum TaxID=2510189 RepID=A0A4U7BRG8_9BACT|nr:autotransporter outer membrane beta-barrel domain-containing protein [Campylobacter estrildidarum]TKX31466.1 autotransporter outer membrane beta-barrel domain-containing protein [Campylobacter estrildidarum]